MAGEDLDCAKSLLIYMLLTCTKTAYPTTTTIIIPSPQYVLHRGPADMFQPQVFWLNLVHNKSAVSF